MIADFFLIFEFEQTLNTRCARSPILASPTRHPLHAPTLNPTQTAERIRLDTPLLHAQFFPRASPKERSHDLESTSPRFSNPAPSSHPTRTHAHTHDRAHARTRARKCTTIYGPYANTPLLPAPPLRSTEAEDTHDEPRDQSIVKKRRATTTTTTRLAPQQRDEHRRRGNRRGGDTIETPPPLPPTGTAVSATRAAR